jgi:NADP-dependent 3-hydroxy acid dehydrogenase YdfG
MAQLIWLVTGCSTGGLGEVFVKQLLQRGDKVIATARRTETIKHLKALGAATLQLDVTADQTTVNNAFTEAIGMYGKIDVLVNNAGFVVAGALEDLT